MPLHFPTLLTRTGSALIFGAIMLVGFIGPHWTFSLLVLLIQYLCLQEYFRLLSGIYEGHSSLFHWSIPVQFLGFAGLLYLSFPGMKEMVGHSPIFVLAPVIVLLFNLSGRIKNMATGFAALSGWLYITLPLALVVLLREENEILPLAVLLMIWVNDTFAYLIGSLIGKTPFSQISPGKTWEGTIGGVLITMISAVLWGGFSQDFHPLHWGVLSFLVTVSGTMGDLLESKMKRQAQVKDSGRLMPGHGGALDRFDSFLVAVPFAFAYYLIFIKPI